MGMLSMFQSMMKNSLVVRKVTTSVVDFVPTTTTVDSQAVPAFVYSRTAGESYFSPGMWKATTDYIAVVEPLAVDVTDKIVVDGVEYAVDYVDDVAFQGEVMLIGLRRVR